MFKLELNKLNYRNQTESFDKSRALICDYLHTKVGSRSLPLDPLYVICGPNYAQFAKTRGFGPAFCQIFVGHKKLKKPKKYNKNKTESD